MTSNDSSCSFTAALRFMPRLTVTFILTFHLTSGIYRLMRMKGIVYNIMKELFELITDIV